MSHHPPSHPFLSVGFRPFFFFGILFACLSGGFWTLFWSPLEPFGWSIQWQPLGGMTFWHAHEMLNGFVFAIIAGFLLTAVQNWTGLRTTTPSTLLLLVTTWIMARVVFLYSAQAPYWLVLVTQILPILGLILAIGTPIILKRMWRNLFVVAALIFFAVNEIRLIALANEGAVAHHIFISQISVVILFVSMIAGRVLPFFMANRLGIEKRNEAKWLFVSCTLPIGCLVLGYSLTESSILFAPILFGLFLVHTLRVIRWYHQKIWQEPMLYSLLISYTTLPLGFLMTAIDLAFNMGWGNTPVHVLTFGSMGALIIAMVGRVSLGHTGRVIKAVPAIKIALLLIVIAFVFRVILPLVSQWHPSLMALSGLFWTLAFLAMFVYFAGIWLKPRPDGR